MKEGRILVVEDDPKIQRLLRTQLTLRGYEVHIAGTGEEAVAAVADIEPSMVLLDITLPGLDGLNVCRQLREWSDVPIILVTAADEVGTKVSALEFGADDYLTKPFHMNELVARMRAVRRRTGSGVGKSMAIVQVGDLHIDLVQRQVHRDQELMHLTKIEFDLLRELVTHAGKILTHADLLKSVWGAGYEDIRLVHVHICNLRRKIEKGPGHPHYLLTVSGVGYRFLLDD